MQPLFEKSPSHFNLHFVGIGGIGMSGIAEVFFNRGYTVTGSDQTESDTTTRLRQLGIGVEIGHDAKNALGKSVVVISSAVKSDNPEVISAKALRIPVIPRAEMLAELMRGKTGIAVAGTHGKTTTTSMLATVLTHAGLDPTLLIGGKVDSLGGNAKLGQGTLVVAEADESDGSFLHLPATYSIVTNIDNDHLDHYGDIKHIEEAFVAFINGIPFYGLSAVCVDDTRIVDCLQQFRKPIVTYGESELADYFFKHARFEGLGTSASLCSRKTGGQELGTLDLQVPGRHNLLNAVGVAALCLEIGIPFETIREGLTYFRGVQRRFEVLYRSANSDRLVIDDYGHHPTEIAATIAAARKFWNGKIKVIFQPHRFSRTKDCWNQFAESFVLADELFLTDVYSAGESPLQNIDSKHLSVHIQKHSKKDFKVVYAPNVESLQNQLLNSFYSGDLILWLGAGSVSKMGRAFSNKVREQL